MNGRVHWFGAAGLANGLAILADEETRSRWDHITGEAFDGPLAGQQLDVWPIEITTVDAALARYPAVKLLCSRHQSPLHWFFNFAQRGSFINRKSFLPPGFRNTMSQAVDPRLDELAQGLGVIDGDRGKFFPMASLAKGEQIDDNWRGRPLRVERRMDDGVLVARWLDDEASPMQLLTRWYGFSFTYPGCEIYEAST